MSIHPLILYFGAGLTSLILFLIINAFTRWYTRAMTESHQAIIGTLVMITAMVFIWPAMLLFVLLYAFRRKIFKTFPR